MSKTEGDKLREALEAVGSSPSAYARALGVSTSAVSKHFDAVTFKPRMWRTVKDGLRGVGGDPNIIRKDTITMARERPGEVGRDLTSLVTGWPKDHLRALYDILSATDQERRDLAFFVRGKIA